MTTSSRSAAGHGQPPAERFAEMLNRCLRLLAVCAILLNAAGCGKPPQVLEDEQSFKAVDALWTAITARKPELLVQATEELRRLHDAGKLSKEGFEALGKISDRAKSGEWEPAAKELKIVIRGQSRPSARTAK